jgi:peptidoglycan/LPS O-acetylase OafA/YrhL
MFEGGWSAKAYLKFLGRRIARVYPLYFVATICGFVLVALGYLEAPHSPIGVAFVLNLLMVQSWGFTESLDGPAWSISAEWAAYLLFPAMLVPCLFRRPSWAWISAAVCIAVIAILCVLPQSLAHRPTPASIIDLHVSQFALPVVRCLPEFALGLLAFRLSSTPFGLALAARRWNATALCVAIIILMAIPRTDFAIVLLFPLLVMSLTSQQNVPGRILSSPSFEFVGRLSYSIYLTHDLMGGLLSRVHVLVEGFGLRHGQTYAAAVGILLTFPCSYLAYRLIEVPGRRWLRAVFERTRPSSIAVEPSAP